MPLCTVTETSKTVRLVDVTSVLNSDLSYIFLSSRPFEMRFPVSSFRDVAWNKEPRMKIHLCDRSIESNHCDVSLEGSSVCVETAVEVSLDTAVLCRG